MKRYILTGAPGSGKTSLIRTLEMNGHIVVHEAATDRIEYDQGLGIKAPWTSPQFIDDIISLQKQRQQQTIGDIQFYDRSPFCTLALAQYLAFTPSPLLLEEIDRIQNNKIYQKEVFFIENLGFITPTDARQITFEETLKFEKIHAQIYEKFGFTLVKVPAENLLDRINKILLKINHRS